MSSPESSKREAPIALRSDRELSVLPVQKSPPAASAAGAAGKDAFATATLTLAGLAMGGGIGWVVQRRARLARRGEPAQEPALPKERQLQAWPGWSSPRGIRSRKRLVKLLLKIRVGAGLVVMLAGIAVLLFWAIEEFDGATKEPRVYLALLGLVLATGIGAWCCGRLANWLHRTLHDCNHPDFDN